jgi:hypothetical protein
MLPVQPQPLGAKDSRVTLSDQPSGKLVERLRKDVARFTEGLELADDLSILVLRWKGGGLA